MKKLDNLRKDIKKNHKSFDRQREAIAYPPLLWISDENKEEANASSMDEFQRRKGTESRWVHLPSSPYSFSPLLHSFFLFCNEKGKKTTDY